MGVYIKSVEMPKSCGNCFYDTRCDNWRLRNWGAPPPDDCPLVPVPPHGRLIDGDKLNDYLKTAAIMADGEAKDAYIDARAEARTMPVIIPAEEGE